MKRSEGNLASRRQRGDGLVVSKRSDLGTKMVTGFVLKS